MTRGVTTLAPWFGSDRMVCERAAVELNGCSWIGIPFAGGMSIVTRLAARTILANDLHRHVINLARVVRDDRLRGQLIRRLRRVLFHPDELVDSQEYCKIMRPDEKPDIECALNYFICCWLNRSGKAGIDDEFNGRTSVRWKSDGGDSMVRFQSAIRALADFGRHFRRCTFETMDAFEFLARVEDIDGHGLYVDPPFPGVGRRYLYNAGQTDAEERAWHVALRDALTRFEHVRIVCRFYDHPMIQDLYPAFAWTWIKLTGRKQSNADAPEVLLVNGPLERTDGLMF